MARPKKPATNTGNKYFISYYSLDWLEYKEMEFLTDDEKMKLIFALVEFGYKRREIPLPTPQLKFMFNHYKGRIMFAQKQKANADKSKGAPKGTVNNPNGNNQYTQPTGEDTAPEVITDPEQVTTAAATIASNREFTNTFKANVYRDKQLLGKLAQICEIDEIKLKIYLDDVFAEWELKGGNLTEVWTVNHLINHVCKKARSKSTTAQSKRYYEESARRALESICTESVSTAEPRQIPDVF